MAADNVPMRFYVDLTPQYARELVQGLREENLGTVDFQTLAGALAKQVPVPALPDKAGAVVRGPEQDFYQRWTYDAHSASPWLQLNSHEEPLRTDELPVITEVLFWGVDL